MKARLLSIEKLKSIYPNWTLSSSKSIFIETTDSFGNHVEWVIATNMMKFFNGKEYYFEEKADNAEYTHFGPYGYSYHSDWFVLTAENNEKVKYRLLSLNDMKKKYATWKNFNIPLSFNDDYGKPVYWHIPPDMEQYFGKEHEFIETDEFSGYTHKGPGNHYYHKDWFNL